MAELEQGGRRKWWLTISRLLDVGSLVGFRWSFGDCFGRIVLFAGAQLFMKQWWWLADLTISGELEVGKKMMENGGVGELLVAANEEEKRRGKWGLWVAASARWFGVESGGVSP
ncbi:hypothetical protein KY290_003541 [Solanum tuberosum]|uniref:Transmembrane protein n=1 Tax=Solanum tuberosum TaxID=4113 RepID=A0ABQ7WV79_SOLTU|nr:hypothetical protein KY284_003687 [Solanum tuberosum]KAH0732692.1 hypothetical protein KY289_003880 [Solanum tuberosum]KAH0767655.1 hypothetical protein KY285_003526 [Solanum tuberosum]KAH0783943.1 hypothetical protein KY290_003541 [Solanum tuberosum]